jgi:hypothetical protein
MVVVTTTSSVVMDQNPDAWMDRLVIPVIAALFRSHFHTSTTTSSVVMDQNPDAWMDRLVIQRDPLTGAWSSTITRPALRAADSRASGAR